MVRILRADIIPDETNQQRFIVAIDGPAGAGKSTAARMLAQRLGFEFLDTGAMYRCVTLAVLRSGIDTNDWPRVAELARQLSISLENDRVWLDGEDVSDAIRTPSVSTAIGVVADNPQVREHLSALQRDWAKDKRAVTEGRDQGTVVFFDSPCKIFLTASDGERARRRCEELAGKGITLPLDEVLRQQRQRDDEDARREIGGLRQADDAHVLVTDGMTLDEVVAAMLEIVQRSMSQASNMHVGAQPTGSAESRDSQIESRS